MPVDKLEICLLRKSPQFPRIFSRKDMLMGSHERALATTLFALAPFLGPVLGPIVGGFVVEKHGFRWVFWVQFIFAW